MVETGLDRIDALLPHLEGRRTGLLAHPASVNRDLKHAYHIFSKHPEINLTCLFGPQHGWLGNDQDNMIEWQSSEKGGLKLFSLYGEHRKPTGAMLDHLDVLVVDLQDVGCRVYTFVQTLYLVMQAAAEHRKKVVVLDRPNPVSGKLEAPVLQKGFETFVGFTEIPLRHGLTIGELAHFYGSLFDCEFEVITMKNYQKSMWFDGTGLPWVMPSPNLPTLESAIVYPGNVLFEATSISEGRGTTRPFETIGARGLSAELYAEELNSLGLPGIIFRPLIFQPVFHKFKEEDCGGVQLHVTDRDAYRSVLTTTAMVLILKKIYENFDWLQPPYEYEEELMPIDILTGSSRFRTAVDSAEPLSYFRDWYAEEESAWKKTEIPGIY